MKYGTLYVDKLYIKKYICISMICCKYVDLSTYMVICIYVNICVGKESIIHEYVDISFINMLV